MSLKEGPPIQVWGKGPRVMTKGHGARDLEGTILEGPLLEGCSLEVALLECTLQVGSLRL